jgi:hypothetical protein
MQRDRYRMIARIVVRNNRRTVVIGGSAGVVVLGQSWMSMCREPMLVLRMFVIGVGVNVQRSAPAGRRGHHQSEQERDQPIHNFSLWDTSKAVKRPRFAAQPPQNRGRRCGPARGPDAAGRTPEAPRSALSDDTLVPTSV